MRGMSLAEPQTTQHVRPCADSGALAGTESCVLASDMQRPAVDAEALQQLRTSCPAEVGALQSNNPR